ncbi:uncharacterized protein zgc:174945 [Sebastes umbrosus]|uniref:uncharacterized protein zgc:174945 n=1 Tax=Sebastes umbrosus TaxID=72105 RepID=UPI00189ED2AF|nr:uncharacterized protein zgc:174945 [Sebastes umbrosus]
MIWLTGLKVLLWVTLCVSSTKEENDTLEVQTITNRNITPARGSSVKLSCIALYDFELYGSLLRVGWYNFTDYELTDPRKYFTTVNETVSDDNRRRRQVVTEILNLTPEDNGQYQCQARCDSGETSVGHYIQITVQGKSSD